MTSSVEQFEAVSKAALEGFETWPADKQESMRRTFIFAFAAGILCEISPDDNGVIVDPERAALRARVRSAFAEYRQANPGDDELALLVKAHEFSVQEYDEMASQHKRFKPEAEIARVAANWVRNNPLVDVVFAREALEYVELLPSTD